ncbi:MAG: thioredoxin family protein [Candidatus Omnitrophica bacterium]|nr:thioredoxin family protein [Candidatus Omnitrophota bacterium]
MALMESIHIPLGTKMSAFELQDARGKIFNSRDLFGTKGLLLTFTCNHCPYAVAIWPRLIKIAEFCTARGIHAVAINPNIHPDYPEDSVQNMLIKIKEWKIPFPYLVDETQKVAKEFKAQCTPDIFLFDKDQTLIYHGRIDDYWKDETKVSRQELKLAIEDYLAGIPLTEKQFPTLGCSIKWR